MKIAYLTTINTNHDTTKVILHDDGAISFMSDRRVIARISAEGLLEIYELSPSVHLDAFMKEYADTDYETAKNLYYQDLLLNVRTGETIQA